MADLSESWLKSQPWLIRLLGSEPAPARLYRTASRTEPGHPRAARQSLHQRAGQPQHRPPRHQLRAWKHLELLLTLLLLVQLLH